MGIISLKGIHLHYSEWGDKDKPPLVLLHGFAQSTKTWEEVAPRLAKDRRVVALDLIGHGKSDKPDEPASYEMGPMLQSISALQRRLWADRIDILGYSMGGRIALTYACTQPHRVSSLILESTGLGPDTAQQHQAMLKRDLDLIERLSTAKIKDFVDFWEGMSIFETQKRLPPEVRKKIRAERLANDPRALALTVRGSGQHTMANLTRQIEALPLPVLYMAGILDRKYLKNAEKLQHNKGISCILANTGHNIHVEDPDAFCRRVQQFLDEPPGKRKKPPRK